MAKLAQDTTYLSSLLAPFGHSIEERPSQHSDISPHAGEELSVEKHAQQEQSCSGRQNERTISDSESVSVISAQVSDFSNKVDFGKKTAKLGLDIEFLSSLLGEYGYSQIEISLS